MAMKLLAVALGSAGGGVVRFLVGRLLASSSGFPWATFSVNVIGSCLIGVLSGLLARGVGGSASEWIRAFAVVGFCGGFTTFSTFSNEAFRMMEASQWTMCATYVIVSVLAGFASVALGYMISR